MLALPPLSLYVHVPWCVKKCPYCDFNSHERADGLPEQAYLEALLKDLDADLKFVQGRRLQSIFIGGGTPSLMSAHFFACLLHEISVRIDLSDTLECTLEANPGTAEAARFAGYREAGINRLSIGVQSFDDSHLRALGRIHDSRAAVTAIGLAQQAGFDNYNLDLMYGLPDQSREQALVDLTQAVDWQPTHLSWYQLTIEPNTVFYRDPPVLPPEDDLFDMLEAGTGLLYAAGFARYEVSAYAAAGRRSLHNLNYWQFGDYIGIGAGASGKLTLPESDQILRTRKVRQPAHYLADKPSFLAQSSAVAPGELDLEFMMNALRLSAGFESTLYETRTGRPFESIRKRLEYLQDEGLLLITGQHVKPTARGELFINSLLEAFL